MQEVRETNFCRISVHGDERTGRVIVFATIDNLWKGTSSQAVQNLNLMFGRDEGEGLPDSRAGSRSPEHVTEVGGGLPAGFRASGVACGLKPSGAPDLGLLVSDAPETVSAARFTRSGVLAAPVLLTQERCRAGRASARWSPTPATPTPPPAAAGSRTRRGCRAPARWSPACPRTAWRSRRPA